MILQCIYHTLLPLPLLVLLHTFKGTKFLVLYEPLSSLQGSIQVQYFNPVGVAEVDWSAGTMTELLTLPPTGQEAQIRQVGYGQNSDIRKWSDWLIYPGILLCLVRWSAG